METHFRVGIAGHSDLTVVFFVPLHIGLESLEQSLGIGRSHDHTGANLRFGQSGQHPGKVEDEFAGAVCNQCKIGIVSIGDLLRQLDVDLLCFLLHFVPPG